MGEFRPIIRGIAYGIKDSVVGMTALLRLDSIFVEIVEERRRGVERVQRPNRTSSHERRKLQRPETKKER